MSVLPTLPRTIGVFDSGVGGLSVLRALHRLRPEHPLHYLADSAHAPYGDRDPAFVAQRSLRLAEHLLAHGAAMLVVACNTATAWAIDALRQRYPQLPLVGVEPGVKPAAAMSQRRRIAVMATTATLASPRFALLVERHAPGCEVLRVPCPGLAAAIERGDDGRDEVEALLDRHLHPLQDSGIDVMVLGCTHYPFVAERIALRLPPQVHLLDTADAVARQALRLLGEAPQTPTPHPWPALRLENTGDPAVLERMARSWLQVDVTARRCNA
ncbi:glutamate racemase [Ideonella sp. 4Y16]|uniref:Glutamate racemase n=1 Tax=Ideonella alba TaxID=2824118 RepID=A0A941BFA3_9BURK|nr:glutamate racemase [Ideonella alba]MBQ0930842.1 glutamate racemase [Ideonella alba]MBQ0942494.1 glutamate racemase [Ideonella alba]